MPLLLILLPKAMIAQAAITPSLFRPVGGGSVPAFASRSFAGIGIRNHRCGGRVGAASVAQETLESSVISISSPPPLQLSRSDELFDLRLEEFRSFAAKHGHGSVPCPYPPNPPLGVWAANLRRQHVLRERLAREEEKRRAAAATDGSQGGEAKQLGDNPSSQSQSMYLTEERNVALLRAGFDFDSLSERRWKAKFRSLERFHRKHGHVLVPEKYADDPSLGAWVSNCRTQYRQRAMAKRRKLLLRPDDQDHHGDDEELDDDDDDDALDELEESQGFRTNSTRSARSGSRLTLERIVALEELGFVWKYDDARWYETFERLKDYAASNYKMLATDDNDDDNDDDSDPPAIQNKRLDFRISPDNDTNRDLRLWCINQRSRYRRKRMTDRVHDESEAIGDGETTTAAATVEEEDSGKLRRILALESIGFPWSGRFSNADEEIEHARWRELRRGGVGPNANGALVGDGGVSGDGEGVVPSLIVDLKKNRWVKEEEEDGGDELLDIMDLWNAEEDDW